MSTGSDRRGFADQSQHPTHPPCPTWPEDYRGAHPRAQSPFKPSLTCHRGAPRRPIPPAHPPTGGGGSVGGCGIPNEGDYDVSGVVSFKSRKFRGFSVLPVYTSGSQLIMPSLPVSAASLPLCYCYKFAVRGGMGVTGSSDALLHNECAFCHGCVTMRGRVAAPPVRGAEMMFSVGFSSIVSTV